MTGEAAAAGVAIVGLACRFPGAPDISSFWKNLSEGAESIRRFSDAELIAEGVDSALLSDPAYVKASPVLDDIGHFDASFFEFSPREASVMDPQQRLFLEVAWHAFEDAGCVPGRSEQPVGVFAGSGGVVSGYLVDRLMASDELPGQTGGLAHIGNDKDFLSTRISYKLNLTGPSVNVQTACSTSLVAVHLACQSIASGECQMALAGAATIRVPQISGYLSVKGDIRSPDGHCRAFDADAKGTLFGSGVGAVLLKNLDDALRDGDNIYAVIRSSVVNNDGAGKTSYTASSVPGQARAMVEALALADISPATVEYVECHGTGTIVGDPLEVSALAQAFRTGTSRKGYCALGSVKTNIGHLEQTAGVAALIKACLCLKHGAIPRIVNFTKPNPKLRLESTPFFINTEHREWPAAGQPRRAAVNSLGLGGTNAFVLLEEGPSPTPGDQKFERPLHVGTVSAKSDRALAQMLERHRRHFGAATDLAVGDACFTLNTGRTHFERRFAAVAGTASELADAMAVAEEEQPAGGAERRIAFLFSGQGSQYAGMGAELYRDHPRFRAILDRCDAALRGVLDRPILEVLFESAEGSGAIDDTLYTQPCLFALQVALADLWASWGVRPHVVIGHSVGEFAAACTAGVYSIEDGLALIAARAKAMQGLPRGGAMAAVFATEEIVSAAIAGLDAIAVAAVNGPRSVVISGDGEAVDAACGELTVRGVKSQPLNVSHAFHSPLIVPALAEIEAAAKRANAQTPSVPWISNLTGEAMAAAPGASYWSDHARGVVRFAEGIGRMGEMGITDFVEIGPGGTLLALARQSLGEEGCAWLPCLSRTRGDWRELLGSLAALYRRGHEVDWEEFDRPYRRRRVSLPGYAFQGEHFWIEGTGMSAGATATARLPGDSAVSPRRIRSALKHSQFESSVGLERHAFLDDHRIYAMPILPTTVGLAAAHHAAARHFGDPLLEIANLSYGEALVLPETGERIVQFIFDPAGEGAADFIVASAAEGEAETWRTNMRGIARRLPGDARERPQPRLDTAVVRKRCTEEIPVDRYYEAIAALGLGYGPSFRGVQQMWRGRGEVLTRVNLPAHVVDEVGAPLHPALLDACLHAYPALVSAYGDFRELPRELRRTYLPVSVDRFALAGSPARTVWAHLVSRDASAAEELLTVDISIHAEDGVWLASIEGLGLKPLPPALLAPAGDRVAECLYSLDWEERPALPVPAKENSGAGGWLILADRRGLGARLARILAQAGGECRLLSLDDPEGCSPRGTGDLAARLTEVMAAMDRTIGGGLSGVIFLSGLEAGFDSSSATAIDEAAQRTAGDALSVCQALVSLREQAGGSPRLWLVSANATRAGTDDGRVEPIQGLLWGLGRSTSLEHPQIWGGLVDLDLPHAAADLEAAAAGLAAEVLSGDGEDQVVLRQGIRRAARLARLPEPQGRAGAGFDVEGLYLVTGGLGSLGLGVAIWLVEQHGVRHLAIASRRGSDDPRAAEAAAALAARGAELTIYKADLSEPADVEGLLAALPASGRTLKGVFHCAGILEDGVLAQMDWPKLRRVLAPKIFAGWLLHNLTLEADLTHFVLFSSVLSLIGAAGQTNYAAANSFLDSLGEERRRRGLPVQVINWGPWGGSGLATLSGEKGEAIWRSRGTEFIPADLGWDVLSWLTERGVPQAAVTITDWGKFVQPFTTPPPLYRRLEARAVKARRPGASANRDDLRQRLERASGEERRDLLIAFVREEATSTLGLSERVEASRPLREYGLDSLMSISLVNRLEASLQVKVPAVVMIQGPSVEQLVDEAFSDLCDASGEAGAEPRPPAMPRSDDWLVVVGPRASARLRLFCFPFAGGGSAVYRGWAERLDPAIEVVAVEPPGRLGRIEEKPVADIREFVMRLAPALVQMLDRPFAFFGHCLGGLTLFEMTRALVHFSEHRPQHLFVSGARPPHLIGDVGRFEKQLMADLRRLAAYRRELPAYLQPEDVFAEIVRHFNIEATERMIADPELRRLMLPVVRAEFAMASHYRHIPERSWDIPITCFTGRDDPYVERRHGLGWERYTRTHFQLHSHDGEHFGLVDDMDYIHDVMNRELRPAA
jgi:acyl transferase domain-containing protein/surfactin synthase thioesterase subunit/acyl carrier protein